MALIDNDSLVDAIKRLLGSVALPGISSSSKHYDLFEAFFFGLVLEAARDVVGRASVWYERPDDAGPGNPSGRTRVVELRTSPGWIHSGPQYTHGVIALPNGKELEVHLGAYVAGPSKIAHEYDIAVIERDEAERARQRGVPPRSSRVVLFIEAKHWASNRPLGMAREFLGLCADSGADLRMLASNSNGVLVSGLLANRRPIGAFHADLDTASSETRDELLHIMRAALRRRAAA
jgi:hypothetical protein